MSRGIQLWQSGFPQNAPILPLGADGQLLVVDSSKAEGVKLVTPNIANGPVVLDSTGKLPAVDGSNLTGIGGTVIVYKDADQTKHDDAVLADDTKLTFAVLANTKYVFELFLIVSTNVTPSFQYQITGPAAPSNLLYTEDKWTEFGAHNNNGVYTAFSQAHDGSCTTGNNIFTFRGVLENGVNAGNVTLQWAQNVSNAANTTVKRGSFLRYQRF